MFARNLLAASAAVLALVQYASAQTPFDNLPTPQVALTPPGSSSPQFISGLDVGWIDSNFGNDLGQNQTPLHGGVNYSTNDFAPYLDLLTKLGGNVTKLLVFEGAQGLVFDSNGYIVGVDQQFIKNLEQRIASLNSRGITVVLSLIEPGADEGYGNGGYATIGQPVTAVDGSTPDVQDYFAPGDAQTDLIYRAIGPLVDQLHNDGFDGGIFSYDVLNEYNGLASFQRNGLYVMSGNTSQDDSFNSARALISGIVKRIQNSYGGYLCVSTENFYNANSGGTYGVADLGLSYLDLHYYAADGSGLPQTQSGGIPAIVGEAGVTGGSLDQNAQNAAITSIAQAAVNNGYVGFLPWWTGAYNAATDANTFIVPNANADPTTYEVTTTAYGTLQQFEGWLNSRGVITPSHY